MGSSGIVGYYLRKITLGALVIIAITWVTSPFIISILYAFAHPDDYYNIKVIIPMKYTLDHIKLLMALGVDKAIINSITVALMTVGISFALGLPAGYAFAKYYFRGKDALRLLMIGLRMFPVMIIAIPLVTFYIRLGLADTLLGVALAHTAMALPFVIIITSSVFSGVPRELEEAALVFGLTGVGAFLKITLPIALPGLAAAAIFTFIMSWNEVFIASVLTLTQRTLPAFILVSAGAAPDFIKFAAGFIIVLPALIFVFIARRYLIALWGITLR